MSTIVKSIAVDVPVQTAYNQWTQFEAFPEFMEGVREVRQLDDTHLHWVAEIAGQKREWDAEITEQIPDKRIAWRTVSGKQNAGSVNFKGLSESSSQILLQLEYPPEGFAENVGEAVGVVERRVEGDLERFKQFIEKRGYETGSWRGEVRDAG